MPPLASLVITVASIPSYYFSDGVTTELYTLSLHDALPIFSIDTDHPSGTQMIAVRTPGSSGLDRKSTRLNSSHLGTSYAVFCLKKKMGRERRRRCRPLPACCSGAGLAPGGNSRCRGRDSYS